tara:strand:- start:8310 stop:8903 length:594 start_codon:yes stop_codon:yes gene_type:complete
MESLKAGQVSKDLEKIKDNEARDLGVQDFFVTRDKKKRGSDGLVKDSSQILGEEVKVKEELYEKSLKVNSIPDHIYPMFGGVFLTARRNKLQENGVYLPTASFGKGSDTDMDVDFSDTQLVLSAGPNVQQVAKGMEVVLNMDSFKKQLSQTMAQKVNRDFTYEIPLQIIDGVEYIYVSERDIKYISNTNGVIKSNNK